MVKSIKDSFGKVKALAKSQEVTPQLILAAPNFYFKNNICQIH